MASPASSGAPESEDGLVGELKHDLFRVLRSLVFRHDLNSPLSDLPLSQMRCLRTIAFREMQKMQDVADKLEIKLPALSQIVERLVKRGLVERHADPGDRRVVLLAPTEMARAILSSERAERDARLLATVSHLDPDALPRIIEGLDLLATAAERVVAEEEARQQRAPSSSPLSPEADPLVEMMARRARTQRTSSRRPRGR